MMARAARARGGARAAARRGAGAGARRAALALLAAVLSSAEPAADRAGPLIAETGTASVLLVGDCHTPPAVDMALCPALQYKLALESLGLTAFVDWRGSHADASDVRELATAVRELRPDLVLYVPELELGRLPDISRMWQAAEEFGIPTAVMLTHLHPGLTINLAEPLWHARYVVSADPAALVHWPTTGNRSSASGVPSTGSVQHIWLPPAAIVRRRTSRGGGGGGPNGESEQNFVPEFVLEDGFMYDVVMLAPDVRQEHVSTAREKTSMRRRIAKYLEGRFGARFHHELVGLHPDGVEMLVRHAKVTVVIGDCLRTCPTSGYWGEGVYAALGLGAFVLHNMVPGMEEHFRNNTHLAYFDLTAGDLNRSLGAKVSHWLQESSSARRELIRRQGRMHVLTNHTYETRARTLLLSIAAAEEALAALQQGHYSWPENREQNAAVLRSLAASPVTTGPRNGGGGRGGK